MHFTSVVPLALVVAPAAVSAFSNLGFALGDKKSDGSCKYTADYAADFAALGSLSTIVRGYSASECNTAQQILPAARTAGVKVVLGVWPDTDDAFNADKAALQTYATQYTDILYAVTVGSEALYRGSLTAEQLNSSIAQVRSILPSTKIGTADSWNKYADGTADLVIQYSDILLANAFAYWQGSTIQNASHLYVDDVEQALARVQSINPNAEFWNGETGWPTDGGSDYGSAQAGTTNAETFWKSSVCALLQFGYNVFYFEAFDEPWKPASVGENGQSAVETVWGAFTSDRTAKFDMTCLSSGS
ncbi:MAG: glycoside hydrolase 3 protein [Pycnora praestabilis]|nr:MAG: glycoside hydrolase 3 protein [Pycnora praestabilis]